MAGAKVVVLAEEKALRSPSGAEPLQEPLCRGGLPIWVQTTNPAHLTSLFRLLHDEFRCAGFDTIAGGLPTDPHPRLAILASSEVHLKTNPREPEPLCTVSLYGAGNAPSLLKLNPDFPGASQTLRDVLARANERNILASCSGEKKDYAISVREQVLAGPGQ